MTVRRARQLRKAMTLVEVMAWTQLRRKQSGYRFRRQAPIGPYVVDFLCPLEKLAVEIDGVSHDYSVERDRLRAAFLERCGYRTLRFGAEEVLQHPEIVLESVRAEIRNPGSVIGEGRPLPPAP